MAGHFQPSEVDVYPENWPALQLFSSLGTQWRTGMSGATGLDYTAVIAVLQFSTAKGQQQERFEEIQIMERAALEAMNQAKT